METRGVPNLSFGKPIQHWSSDIRGPEAPKKRITKVQGTRCVSSRYPQKLRLDVKGKGDLHKFIRSVHRSWWLAWSGGRVIYETATQFNQDCIVHIQRDPLTISIIRKISPPRKISVKAPSPKNLKELGVQAERSQVTKLYSTPYHLRRLLYRTAFNDPAYPAWYEIFASTATQLLFMLTG